MTARYSIGIDLGTTNSVVAFTPLEGDSPQLSLLPIPQIVGPGEVESRDALPSFLYLLEEDEAATYALPWDTETPRYAVGEWARTKSAQVPQRVVVAAKSWLCHSRVDRRDAILPWQAPAEVPKISPIAVTEAYLRHLAAAWNQARSDAPLADQNVVLTVPASFDPAARELTREAALSAGFPTDFVLLEEPQAAVYRWLEGRGDQWRRELNAGDSLLVIDVGGGTTDLTLVRLVDPAGTVELERQAVGNHLLVGGDNMDLALAHLVAGKLAEEGHNLDPWQNIALWHSCRAAKERLLASEGAPRQTLSVLGRGSRLIGGTITTELEREAVAELLLGGFFPRCSIDARPERQHVSGFQDIGLPYESDPAVTRHIAAFLASHRRDGETSSLPTHLLFNGGVFRSPALREAVVETFAEWSRDSPPTMLGGPEDLDHAVALGAAYYGWSKLRGGLRIHGGTARSYYIGIETAGLAIPGAPRPLRALCVAPLGMEEGTEVDVPSEEVGVVVGRPARFRFFSSTVRREDRPGDRLDRWNPNELVESDTIEATLDSGAAGEDPFLPVRFQSRVTELGMFELYCHSTRSEDRWKMEFNAREDGPA